MVNVNELGLILSSICNYVEVNSVKKIFYALDKNKNGFIG